MSKKFKMRRAPKEPKKGRNKSSIDVNHLSLHEVLNDLPYNDPTFTGDFRVLDGDCYSDPSCILEWSSDESDEQFSFRYKKYLIELEKYNKWAEKHKEQIRQYKKEKEEKEKEKQKKEEERRRKRKEKELEEKRKLYERLKKELERNE